MTPLADAMADGAAAVERVLDSLLQVPEGPEERVFEAMRYSALGAGKRLRPFLVLASARIFGVPDERALRAGAAVELVHCYSLIHDDLPAMDDDDLRRGKPSCHKAFDEATAILAGDALQALAFEVLAVHGSANASLAAGYGYTGILVAFLARHNPLAIVPVAILLAGFEASSGLVQRRMDLPDAATLVLQGMVFVVILVSETLYGRFRIFAPERWGSR